MEYQVMSLLLDERIQPARDTEQDTLKKPTTCYMCAYDCPCDAQIDKNGAVVAVEGKLCRRGRHQVDLQYHPDRLLYPLLREIGNFRRITWVEALDRIADQLLTIRENYGPESVAFFAGYPKEGWPLLQRLAYLFGSPHYLTECSFCFASANIGTYLNYGDEYTNFVSTGRIRFEETQCHLMWSTNPGHSATPKMYAEFLDACHRGMKHIVVDPRRTEVADTATIHLQLRPGTDGALALGMINVILNEQLYDRDFVENWTIGFDELRDLVGGYPPKHVSEITGVPAEKLIAAARMYATSKPAKLQTSPCATTHTTNGVQNHRAVTLLPALTGNLDIPGGNMLADPMAPTKDISLFDERIHSLKPRAGEASFPIWTDFYQEGQANAIIDQMFTADPYPIKALIGVGMNVMIWPNTERVKSAIRNLDFFTVIDYFHTATTDLAQVILPTATWLERSSLVKRPGGLVQLRDPVVEPSGEAWPDWKFIVELGKRLGYGRDLWNGDFDAYANDVLTPAGLTVDMLRQHPGGIRVSVPRREPKSYQQTGFNTPSGKVEIHSSILESHGYDPLPVYREPAEGPVSTPEIAEEYPLVLTTGGRSKAYTHSQFRQIEALRKIMPDPVVQISPTDAEARHIIPGMPVRVTTSRGQIRVKAEITDRLPTGVVHIFHGWWEADANELTDDQALDPISGYPPFKSALCEVTALWF